MLKEPVECQCVYVCAWEAQLYMVVLVAQLAAGRSFRDDVGAVTSSKRQQSQFTETWLWLVL